MEDLSALKAGVPSPESLKGNAFNAVRLLCCAMVVAGHCLSISRTQSAVRPLIDMHVAVCAFFVLSGFWVTASYMGCKSLKEFFCKRASRILPLYYLAVAGFALACAFYSELAPAQYFASAEFWKYLFWNALFLNFMHPSLPGVFGGGSKRFSLDNQDRNRLLHCPADHCACFARPAFTKKAQPLFGAPLRSFCPMAIPD